MSTDFALRVSGVSLSFGGVRALDDVTVELTEGSRLGVIGPNGSGKTTLLNVVTGIYRPESGSVHLAGELVTGFKPSRRSRQGLVRTFQHPQLAASLTLEENVAIGSALAAKRQVEGGPRSEREPALREHAAVFLERFGIARFGDLLPDRAPYGARKLAEVARACAARPDVLLLDEPAAGLSREERTELSDALRSMFAEYPPMAAMIIEHDISFVNALCRELVVLSRGAVIARGESMRVLNDQAVREAYLGKKTAHEFAEEVQDA